MLFKVILIFFWFNDRLGMFLASLVTEARKKWHPFTLKVKISSFFEMSFGRFYRTRENSFTIHTPLNWVTSNQTFLFWRCRRNHFSLAVICEQKKKEEDNRSRISLENLNGIIKWLDRIRRIEHSYKHRVTSTNVNSIWLLLNISSLSKYEHVMIVKKLNHFIFRNFLIF